jgi:hypothetical protein
MQTLMGELPCTTPQGSHEAVNRSGMTISRDCTANDGVYTSLERHNSAPQAGDYFGNMAVLSSEPRFATVRALVPTALYGLFKGSVWRCYSANHGSRRPTHELWSSAGQPWTSSHPPQ